MQWFYGPVLWIMGLRMEEEILGAIIQGYNASTIQRPVLGRRDVQANVGVVVVDPQDRTHLHVT